MFASLHTSTMAVRHVGRRGNRAEFAQTPIKRLQAALLIRKERKALARLDDFLLADIGLTPEDAAKEAARPLWDAPKSWFRIN